MAGMEFELSFAMISLPIKETFDASFMGLKPLISGCYGEDPESFDAEIKQLDRLRQTHVTKDYAGCSLLRKYFAQLHLLDARFPRSITGGVIPLEFKWKDAFTGKQYLQEGIKMEQASILFNLAALHSQLGAKSERLSEQEIKEACTHFQCAAGVLVYLYDNFGANYCKDMAPELIEMFKTLMLAQAQECYVEKSIKFTSGVKFATVSKLGAKLYEYYQFVLANLESDSCVAVVKANKDWPKMIQIKTQYYLALSHFFQGGVCKEQGKYGEMVVYYIAAVQVLDKIGKLPKGINDSLRKAVQWLADTAKKEAAEAKKQNDYVYHEKLPPMEQLEAVQGAALAKPNIFQPADPAVIGVDIFSRLVPMTAHEQSSVYSEEKAKLLRTIAAQVEEKDSELEQYLGGLNIAELRKAQHYKPIVPVQIKQKVEWFQQHIEDVNTLRSQLEELKATCNHVDEQLKMITARKEQEDNNEKQFQSQYGSRTESQVCKELWHELDTCVKYHYKAAQSNNELDSLYRQHSVNINLLTNSMESVMANLPKVNLLESPTVEDSDTERLDIVMEEVDKMKKQRKELMTQLREQLSHDDITSSIIGQKENEQEVAMTHRLQKHKDLVVIIEQNLTAQEKILQALTDVNAKHAVLRETQQDISGKQEQYFGALLQSADVFPVLQSKVQEGLRFFSQLEDKVTKLQRRTNDICDHQQRKREAQHRNAPAPPTSSGPSTAATSPTTTRPSPVVSHDLPSVTSHDLPPVRPPKRIDQRGEPLTNQSTSNQPYPALPAVGNDMNEPVSFQQPLSSITQNISSQEYNNEQQGFLLQQDGFVPQQHGPPSHLQGLPLQQHGPPPQQHGPPPQQQGLPPPQQGLPSLQQQQQEFPPQLPDNVEQQGALPDQQPMLPQQPTLLLTQDVISEQQTISFQQQQLHPEQKSLTPQPVESSPELSVHASQSTAVTSGISCNTKDNISPLVINNSLTITSQSSSSDDVMIQSLRYSISNNPSIMSESDITSFAPSSTAVASIMSSEDVTSSSALQTMTSPCSSIQSGSVITTTIQIPRSNSLDHMNPFALLGEKKLSKDENSSIRSAVTVPMTSASTDTTAAITEPIVTVSIDALLQKQQEQHSMELRKERKLLLEQLELHKQQQEQDKMMMSSSHTALLQLVQQQQQSIHQQQIAIQQCHKENALLRQDRDAMEGKHRSMITEEQGKQQSLQQQLALSTNECQQYKQQIEVQQQHLQQLSHAVKMMDEQNKQLMQQHANQLSHLEQQHKQYTAGLEEKHRTALSQLQQEHRAVENGYKQEIDRLTQHITAITNRQQQMKSKPIYQQQPLPKIQGQPLTPQSQQLPIQQPMQAPQQSYQPRPPQGVLYMQKPVVPQPHPHQSSAQQPHPQAASMAAPYYTQASQEHLNSYQKPPQRP